MEQVKEYYQAWNDLPQPRKMNILKVITFFLYAMFLLFVVIYGFGVSVGKGKRNIQKTVLFMEAMPYNLQSLRYLAKRRDFSISMIILTVNSWNVDLNAAYENVASFLQLMRSEGLSTQIPLYYGNSYALTDYETVISYELSTTASTCSNRRYLKPTLSLNADRLFGGSDLLDKVASTTSSTDFKYYETPLNEHLGGNSVNFLVLGPTTDAALFLQRFPNRRSRVSSVVVAGGSFSSQGRDAQYIYSNNTKAEINFFFDPVAADYIMQGAHGRPVVLLPTDATIAWNEDLYQSLITSKASTTSVNSASVVGLSVQGYRAAMGASGMNKNLIGVELMASVYLSDVYVQNDARVMSIPVKVLYGSTPSKNGESYRPYEGSFNVKVILSLVSSNVERSLKNVDSLSFV